MTSELQRTMARYEEARIRYQKAVLASLHGVSNGEAIRQAIGGIQAASADLKRLTAPPLAPPAHLAPKARAAPKAPQALPAPKAIQAPEASAVPGWSFVLRLLKVG